MNMKGEGVQKIYALEADFAQDYVAKLENASRADIEAAQNYYGEAIPDSILSFDGNTAHISITGPLSRRCVDPLHKYYGYDGTGYSEITDAIAEAENTPDINQIVFDMDTPGGEVMGVDKVWSAIADCKLRTVAVNHGMIASAGYWIASACDKIYASESSNLTGSIGVVITAVDFSKAYEDFGIKIVNIVSRNAPDKRPDIKTKSGKDVLQEQADAIENVFMTRIAKGRNTTLKAVRENYGRGKMLIAENPDGPDSQKIGMIDGMYDDVSDPETNQVNDDMQISENPTPEGANMEEGMNLNEFLASNPDAKALYDANISAARSEGVEAGKADVQRRIDATAKYIGNPEYKGMEPLVKNVLAGSSDVSALEGAVTAFDMMKQQGASNAAQTESVEGADAHGELNQQVASDDGTVANEAQYQAEIARARGGEV